LLETYSTTGKVRPLASPSPELDPQVSSIALDPAGRTSASI
jgi:hypothetical protein